MNQSFLETFQLNGMNSFEISISCINSILEKGYLSKTKTISDKMWEFFPVLLIGGGAEGIFGFKYIKEVSLALRSFIRSDAMKICDSPRSRAGNLQDILIEFITVSLKELRKASNFEGCISITEIIIDMLPNMKEKLDEELIGILQLVVGDLEHLRHLPADRIRGMWIQ